MERLLIIHQGALGDVVLCFPAFMALKREKGAVLDILCRHQIGRAAESLQVVDAWYDVDAPRFFRLFGDVIDPVLSGFFQRYDGVVLIGFSKDMERHLVKNYHQNTIRIPPRAPVNEERHVTDHVMLALREKGVLTEGQYSCKKIWTQIERSCGARKEGRDLLLIHPGAGSRRKRWPVKRFMDIAVRLGKDGGKVTFLLGPAERDLLKTLKESRAGQWAVQLTDDLTHVVRLLQKTALFMGNDSGLTHLAAYMGVPTVAVFGPTHPKRWAPVGPCVTVLRGDPCEPCFETREGNCDEPLCLSQVTVEVVLTAVSRLTG